MLALLDPGIETALQLTCDLAGDEGVLHGFGLDRTGQHEEELYRPDVPVGAEVSRVGARLVALREEACGGRPLLLHRNVVLAVLQDAVHEGLGSHELVVEGRVLAHLQESVLLLLDVVSLFATPAQLALLLVVLMVDCVNLGIVSAPYLEHVGLEEEFSRYLLLALLHRLVNAEVVEGLGGLAAVSGLLRVALDWFESTYHEYRLGSLLLAGGHLLTECVLPLQLLPLSFLMLAFLLGLQLLLQDLSPLCGGECAQAALFVRVVQHRIRRELLLLREANVLAVFLLGC